LSLRCRACIKCKTYIVIHPDNPINQVDIKKFEKNHSGHTVVTVDINEIKGVYAVFTDNGGAQTSNENV